MQELQEKVQTLDSREVAKMVEKRHTDLIRTIENYRNYLDDSQNAKLRSDDFFTESSYRSGTGKKYKCYFITKKGCELIAHKMTGKKHIQFTAAYINKFHEMENKLNSNSSLPQPKAEEITPKYHNGEPVITIQDIVKLSDLNVNTIRYYVRRLERNKDYYLLEWEDLAKFKRNNPSIDKMISSLCVINRQGAEKLAQMIQGVPIQDCFKILKPNNELKWSKKLYVDIPDNNDAQKLINNIRRKATTLTELMAQVDMYVAEDEYQAAVKVIDRLGVSILVCCNDLKRIKYNLSEKYA